MTTIRYSLHFALLVVASLIYLMFLNANLPLWTNRFTLCFGLIGFLHATVIVASLRDLKAVRPLLALCFIALATCLSIATPFVGMWSAALWSPFNRIEPSGSLAFSLLLVTASAIGSAGYWLLVRLFWLKNLRRSGCLRTMALCVASTLLTAFAGAMLPFKVVARNFDYTIPWWLAFSLSLYWSQRSDKRREEPVLTTAML